MSPTIVEHDAQIADALLRQVFAYWQEKAAGRGTLPARADIDPVDLAAVLPAVSLIEVRRDVMGRPGRLRYRVMGGFHVEIMGHDATGELLDLGAGENDAAAQAIATGRPIYAERTFYPANGTVLTFGTLMCPLATDGRKVDMLICAVAPRYKANDLPVARVNRFARAALETVARR
jgi:hypothetical protein